MRIALVKFVLGTISSLEREDVMLLRNLAVALRRRDLKTARDLMFMFMQQAKFAGDHIDL